eukprot:5862-Rhodomonas_salina.1
MIQRHKRKLPHSDPRCECKARPHGTAATVKPSVEGCGFRDTEGFCIPSSSDAGWDACGRV